MRVERDRITIELENSSEIDDFWNIVMFALDLHQERQNAGKTCMTKSEHNMAEKLVNLTKNNW